MEHQVVFSKLIREVPTVELWRRLANAGLGIDLTFRRVLQSMWFGWLAQLAATLASPPKEKSMMTAISDP